MGGSRPCLLRPYQVEAVFVGLIDFSVLSSSALECQTLTLPLMDTLTLNWESTFLSATVFLKPKPSQEFRIKSSAIVLLLKIYLFHWVVGLPERLIGPGFSDLRMQPLIHHAIRNSALSRWILQTRNTDYFRSVRRQSAPPPHHPALTLHQNAANTFAPSSNVGFQGTVGFKMHDAMAESIISILYYEWKFNVQI